MAFKDGFPNFILDAANNDEQMFINIDLKKTQTSKYKDPRWIIFLKKENFPKP